MSPDEHVEEVRVAARSIRPFQRLVGADRYRKSMEVATRLRVRLMRRVLWNINSTAVGGGVAEMLRPLIGYARGTGIDARWLVIRGSPEFFRITKRLHHALHGSRGDGTELDEKARVVYETTLRENALQLSSHVRSEDIVLLHDPQTAGLAPHLQAAGSLVVWRSHIGHDRSNGEVERGWGFLRPYLEDVPAFVFSRGAYVPPYLDAGRSTVIQPSIDAFACKNQPLGQRRIQSILTHVGIVEGPEPRDSHLVFRREDGSRARVEGRADVVRLGRAAAWNTPLVVQISRWDPLKDPIGVLRGFESLCNGRTPAEAELVLAGPNVHGVADDPEAPRVLDEVIDAWRDLPHGVRDRSHIVSLPTADVEENAIIVNALQRHAAIVVQKSLHEGFGLTVAEAIWKSRPVVASAVGGIRDQIEDGVSGYLLEDPNDIKSFGEILHKLLEDPQRAQRLGEAARERVRKHFLGLRHLLQYAILIEKLDG